MTDSIMGEMGFVPSCAFPRPNGSLRWKIPPNKAEGEECAGQQETNEDRIRGFHGAVCSPPSIPERAVGPLID